MPLVCIVMIRRRFFSDSKLWFVRLESLGWLTNLWAILNFILFGSLFQTSMAIYNIRILYMIEQITNHILYSDIQLFYVATRKNIYSFIPQFDQLRFFSLHRYLRYTFRYVHSSSNHLTQIWQITMLVSDCLHKNNDNIAYFLAFCTAALISANI